MIPGHGNPGQRRFLKAFCHQTSRGIAFVFFVILSAGGWDPDRGSRFSFATCLATLAAQF